MKALVVLLGPLRMGLLGLAIADVLLHAVWLLIGPGEGIEPGRLGWQAIPAIVAPVLAPILMVVLLFDIIMSRVQAADDPANKASRYRLIGRIDLVFIALLLLYWVPFFVYLQASR